jgi:hypothetical protein
VNHICELTRFFVDLLDALLPLQIKFNRTYTLKTGDPAVLKEKRARHFCSARFFSCSGGRERLVGGGCRRGRRYVRLLREAALALGFTDISHGAVEVGVRSVGRVRFRLTRDHLVDE